MPSSQAIPEKGALAVTVPCVSTIVVLFLCVSNVSTLSIDFLLDEDLAHGQASCSAPVLPPGVLSPL